MVTAVGQVSSYNKGYEIQRYLLLGDRRGGVSIYVIPAPSSLPSTDDEGGEGCIEVKASQYFHKTHGGESVSCFAATKGRLYYWRRGCNSEVLFCYPALRAG